MNKEEIKKRFEAIEKRLNMLENIPRKGSKIIQNGSTNDIFEKQDGKIFVTKMLGNNIKEKTKNIVLLTLLGYKQKLEEINVHTSKLRENVAIHEIPLENFGTYVKELIPQSIIKKGNKGSNKVTYKLTTFGEAKAKGLLNEVISNDS